MGPHGNRRAPLAAQVAYGVAELRPDPARAAGWTLLVDGVAQSYVDLDNPAYLEFAYVRRLAAVLRLAAPVAVPLRVLHLGGGGLTLARLVSATRPGSSQTVVERDGELIALVMRLLPLAAAVEVVVGDARAELDHDEPDGYDVIVVDVFDGGWMPVSVAGVGFAAAAARRLRPGGLLGMNLTDVPPLAYSRIQAATLATAFGQVGLIAEPALLRGRRAGNVVLVAAHSPGDLPVAELAAAVARDRAPGRLLHGPELASFTAGAKPRLDAPA